MKSKATLFIALQTILFIAWLFFNNQYPLPLWLKVTGGITPIIAQAIFLYQITSPLSEIYIAVSSILCSLLLFYMCFEITLFKTTIHNLIHWIQSPLFLALHLLFIRTLR